MEYLDFEVEIERLSGQAYRVAARSPAGDGHVIMHFPFNELALKDLHKDLRIALLSSAGLYRQMLSPEEQTVRSFGQQVFDAMIAGEVRDIYHQNVQMAELQGKGLRMKLCILAPELAALPWEYLFDQHQGKYLCLSRHTSLVRTLALPRPVQPLTVTPPLRILGMIASPGDQARLDIAREQRRMREALQDLEARKLVELHWLGGQTWRALNRAMRGGPWHVFHFIGHGGFDPRLDQGVLALANEEGRSHLLTAEQVGLLLETHQTLRLVFLNACEGSQGSQRDLFSSTAVTLARQGIPAVLAMQYAITDRAAIECTRAFYEGLAEGLPVDEAMTEARRAIHLEMQHSLEWGTPLLYLRASDSILFDLTAQPPAPQSELVSVTITTREPEPAEPLPALVNQPGPAPAQAGASPTVTRTQDSEPEQSDGPITSQTATPKPERGATLLILSGHTDSVLGVAWSPDGTRLATASRDLTVRLWDGTSGQMLATLKGHTDSVLGVAWSPDGVYLATASGDQTVCLWDAASGQPLTTLKGHTGLVYAVAWSPDGTRIASGGGKVVPKRDNNVHLWDAASGQLLATLKGHAGPVYCVAWSPDGARLASASLDETVRLWDADRRKRLATLSNHDNIVQAVAWSPDGNHIASASFDRTVRLWDADSGQQLAIFKGHTEAVYGVAWSPDGAHLATASGDQTVRLWDGTGGRPLATFIGHSSRTKTVAWSPDGKRIASSSDDQTVRVWWVG